MYTVLERPIFFSLSQPAVPKDLYSLTSTKPRMPLKSICGNLHNVI